MTEFVDHYIFRINITLICILNISDFFPQIIYIYKEKKLIKAIVGILGKTTFKEKQMLSSS